MTASADLWDRCLETLKKDLNHQSFDTWFKSTKASVEENTQTLKVQVPNEFFRDWIRDHYQPQIQKALKTLHPEQLEIQFEVEPTSQVTEPLPFSPENKASVEVVEKAPLAPSRVHGATEIVLNTKFVFENFVVGNSNRFAHAACLAVADSPARSYNPLFIYGGVGLGKTHLLQAIGNHVTEQNPNAKVLYISSEKFMNDFIQSIQSGRQQDFHVSLLEPKDFVEDAHRRNMDFAFDVQVQYR